MASLPHGSSRPQRPSSQDREELKFDPHARVATLPPSAADPTIGMPPRSVRVYEENQLLQQDENYPIRKSSNDDVIAPRQQMIFTGYRLGMAIRAQMPLIPPILHSPEGPFLYPYPNPCFYGPRFMNPFGHFPTLSLSGFSHPGLIPPPIPSQIPPPISPSLPQHSPLMHPGVDPYLPVPGIGISGLVRQQAMGANAMPVAGGAREEEEKEPSLSEQPDAPERKALFGGSAYKRRNVYKSILRHMQSNIRRRHDTLVARLQNAGYTQQAIEHAFFRVSHYNDLESGRGAKQLARGLVNKMIAQKTIYTHILQDTLQALAQDWERGKHGKVSSQNFETYKHACQTYYDETVRLLGPPPPDPSPPVNRT